MASYLRPRRGKKATATSQLTASNPLKRGEIFFEVPDTGVGTGTGKIKMGDGTTAYASLPYFMQQPTVDYTNAVVAWTNTTAASSAPYTDNATYVGNIIPSASLKTIFTNLKKLLLNYNSQLTKLNNDLGTVKTTVGGICTLESRITGVTPGSSTLSTNVLAVASFKVTKTGWYLIESRLRIITNTKGVTFYISDSIPTYSLQYYNGSYADTINHAHSISYIHFAYLYNTTTYYIYGQVMENSGGSATLDSGSLVWVSARLLK